MGRGGSSGVPSHVMTHPSLSHLSTAARNGLFRSNFTGSNFTGKFGKNPRFRNALIEKQRWSVMVQFSVLILAGRRTHPAPTWTRNQTYNRIFNPRLGVLLTMPPLHA